MLWSHMSGGWLTPTSTIQPATYVVHSALPSIFLHWRFGIRCRLESCSAVITGSVSPPEAFGTQANSVFVPRLFEYTEEPLSHQTYFPKELWDIPWLWRQDLLTICQLRWAALSFISHFRLLFGLCGVNTYLFEFAWMLFGNPKEDPKVRSRCGPTHHLGTFCLMM